MKVSFWAVCPRRVWYANGAVGKVFAPARVSAAALNVHRGVLTILQLNLKNTQNVYEMHEAGPHGVCKTHYMITEDEKTHEITVLKSKDLTNCHERVIKDTGFAHAEKCVECQQVKSNLLEDSIVPAFVIIARAVRSDRKLGYQLAAYLDKPNSRAQLVLSSISNDQWKLCADGVLSSKHKARVGWGSECQDSSATVKAETGLHESSPAARFQLDWDKAPRLVTTAAMNAIRYFQKIQNHKYHVRLNHTVGIIIALPTKRSADVIVKTPRMTAAKMAMPLPFALPVEKDGSIPNIVFLLWLFKDLS
uniref:Vitellogenin domain-containing protein n=1 Tax=Pygocentrus nattereri TaxID=42514 RepID=A0AAR2L383_PYGNA